ncbi:MAG: type II secretion system minor pseudopilin GspJ [Pseudomonadales bacterium]|jgi:general secretion pathway protein J|nr:type II secretion system minor pseudopilin GspJ [Pseudomonadales bacterium]MDP7359835.1 type II secretion system minor pseudopilin GspJ [Pseudomonadales bacterium]MDP7595703.1 type II secretion system minor pseudopilin GspJ [Pseudomonadales bacterium]HJN49183.1 type II secretion system minor pseudopilin GspJ [Pseudomonadales bacterium]|tara:strand:- start:1200 stop:1925 length:726 start_codon:yes stop_codon:yes gene_type:complete
MRSPGFTLLEVLVAISIFALIGLGTNQVLRTIINARDVTEARTEQFIRLQRALVVIERDLTQLTNRPIRDELGDPAHALLIGSDLYDLEFTRLGWRNPIDAMRSNVQRVAYQLLEGELLRHYWLVLDRAEDSLPVTQKILTDVEDFRITALSANGETTYQWPLDNDKPGLELPTSLEMFFSMEGIGEIRKAVNLVAVPKLTTGHGDEPDGQGGEGDGSVEGDEDEEDEEEDEDDEDEDEDD